MIPPDHEIYEVEKRIAERRHRIEAMVKQTGRSALRALTSPWALAGAAAIGYLAAGGMQRRRQEPEQRMSASDRKASKASAFSGLAMTAVTWLIKSQFGSPVAMAQYFLAKLKKEPDPRRMAAPARRSSGVNDRVPSTTRS